MIVQALPSQLQMWDSLPRMAMQSSPLLSAADTALLESVVVGDADVAPSPRKRRWKSGVLKPVHPNIDRPEPAASEPTVASLMVTIIDQQREIDRLNQCVSELDMTLLRARNTNVELVASFFKSNFPKAKLADCSF